MANVDIRVGKKDAAFFSANPTLILKDGQFLFNSDTLELFIGDGTTQLSALVAINVPPSSGVQSVTGPQVDDTDPNNPIVNPLGLIQIIDLNGEIFTDLATATAYIEQFFTDPTIITDKSFKEGIFFFTVPENTSMDVNLIFLSNLDGVTFNTASFIDNFGLITSFLGESSFQLTNGKFIFGGDVEFTNYCFYNSNAYVEINNLKSTLGADYLFSDSNATVKIFGNIGENETANFGIDIMPNVNINGNGEKAVGYNIEWKKVLAAEGEGVYSFEYEATTLFGATSIKNTPSYCLKQYTVERADGTVRIEYYLNGVIGKTENDKKVRDYLKSNWYNMHRFDGYFFYQNSQYKVNEIQYQNGFIDEVEHGQTPEYLMKIKPIPFFKHDILRTDILMSNRILVTDYNTKNIDNYYQKEVKKNGNYEPIVHPMQRQIAGVEIKFKQAYNNLNKYRS